MPTNYIKKLSKEGKGTVPELEKDWDRAEKLADKQGKGDNYAYRTAIFKSLSGVESSADDMLPGAPVQIGAAHRLKTKLTEPK